MPQGIVVLVVTDDEEAVRSRLSDLGQDSLGAAGVVAITSPRGSGTTRILTELQQAWLLGYGDVSIVSPVSTSEKKIGTRFVLPYLIYLVPRTW